MAYGVGLLGTFAVVAYLGLARCQYHQKKEQHRNFGNVDIHVMVFDVILLQTILTAFYIFYNCDIHTQNLNSEHSMAYGVGLLGAFPVVAYLGLARCQYHQKKEQHLYFTNWDVHFCKIFFQSK